MRAARHGVLIAVALTAWLTVPGAARDTCVECHSLFDEARLSGPVKSYRADIHYARGLGCASCHGGDPNEEDISSMDPAKGFRSLNRRSDVAEMCARCHANAAYMKHFNPRPYIFSVDEYRTSVHCRREADGDQKVATCTNCHGVHGILPVKDPSSPVYPTNIPKTCAKCHNAEYMKGRTVRTDQFELYSKSVHGRALLERGDVSAPACNDCHGNHGAAPPGVKDVSLVCGTCHGREAELFAKSRMKTAMEHEGKQGCVTCHSNHDIQKPTDAMLSTGPGGTCGGCHDAGSKAESETAKILEGFAELQREVARSDSLLRLAEMRGMETTDARAAWKESQDHVVAMRASIHSFDPVAIGAALEDANGLADRASEFGRHAIADWRTRRVGLASSLGVIVLLIALLLGKIRQMER